MEFNPVNPLQNRHHSSNRAFELIQIYSNLEVGFMAARGYFKQQKLIGIRSVEISPIEEDVIYVLMMELQILEWRIQRVNVITFTSYLLPLPKTDSQQQLLPITPVFQIIVAIQRDTRFTEFRLSTLAASTILVTSYKLLPELHSAFCDTEVIQCFGELKEHVISDYVLFPAKQPRVLKETHIWCARQDKGKAILIEDSATESEQISEITKEEEKPKPIERAEIVMIMELDLNSLNRQPSRRSKPKRVRFRNTDEF